VSFLVASGHVQVDANTRDAKNEIQDLIRAMGGVSPTAQAAANALKDLGKRATTASQSLGRMGERAEDAERALAGLRAVAGDIRVKAELNDETSAGVAAVKAAIQDLKAQSPVRIDVSFDGDTAQLLATAQALRDLKDNAGDAGQVLGSLALRAAVAAAALNELENAAQGASRALRTLRGRAAATADAMRDLRDATSRTSMALRTFGNRVDGLDGRVSALSDRTRTLRRDMDDLDGSVRRVAGGFGALRPRIGGVGSSAGSTSGNMQKLMAVAIALSTALIPVGASLTAIAAKTVAAGAGVVAFAVAVAGQVKDLVAAAQAQTKYTEAVDEHGRGSKEAAEAALTQQRILAKMPPASQEAAAALSVLREEYRGWSDALAADTMPVVTKSLGLFQAMLPRLTPTVRGVSNELQHMLDVAAGGMQTPGFERFMDKLADWSAGAIADATRGLVEFSQALDSGEVSSDLEEFMDYVRANGPLVGETLRNLARALTNLIVGASDVGVSVLSVANAFAKMVNAIPPEVLSTILQLYAGMKLLKVGMAGVAAAASSAAVANLTAFVRAARFGGVGSAIAGVTQRMTLLQKVGGSLGVLGIGAFAINELAKASRGAPPDVDKLTASLKTLSATGKFTGELKATFGDMDGFVAKLGKLRTESAALEKAEPFLAFSGLGAFADTAVTKLDDLVRGTKSVGATKDDFKSFDQGLAAMATNGYANQAAEQFRSFKAAALAGGMSLKDFNAAFPEYNAAAAGLKAEAELAAAGMGVFGQQALATKAKLDAQKSAADGLRASILALNDVNRSAYDAQIQFEAGIDALTASFKEHGATLNLDTAAGQANGQAMSAAAKGHDEMVASGLAAGESLAAMTSKSDKLRSTMMRLATEAFGGNKKAAEEYVNKLLGVPSEVKTMIKAERQEAITGLQAVQAEIRKTPGAKSVRVDTLNAAAIKALEAVGLKTKQLPDGQTQVFTANGKSLGSIGAVRSALDKLNGKTANTYTNHNITYHYRSDGASFLGPSGRYATGGRVRRYASGGSVQAFPMGGYVDGPGSGTSDSILAMMGSGAAAMVSNTEYVMRSAAVAKYGVRFMDAVNSGRLRLPGFAKGGKLTEKQKAAIQSQKEAKSFLKGQSTLTDMSIFAGVQNAEISSKLGKERSESALVDFLNQLQTQVSKAGFSKKTNAALQGQITSSAKKLFSLNDQYDKVTASLEKAKTSLDDLKGKFDTLKTSVTSSLVGFGNITKIGKYGTSADTLINQLRSDTGRTTEFAKQLEQLKARGLNATAISDIAAAGVTGGGMATAQSLLNATPAQIAEINALQKQLEASASKAGTVTADAMYGAGIRAAEGLVKGLTSQQKAIEASMMAIAKSMEKAIKKALGIKSPSKVMEPIGDFAFQGVEQGWVKRAAAGNTLLAGNTAGLRVRPALLTGATSAAPATAAPTVNLTATFNTMTLPTAAERKAFAQAMVKDFNDALLDYQKGRRR